MHATATVFSATDLVDGDLVRLHLDGDAAAFEELHRRYFGRLVAYCCARGDAGRDAEDLAQETLLRALQAADSFDCDRTMWPWLKTIACNLLNDRAIRNRVVVIDLTDDTTILSQGNDPSALDRVEQAVVHEDSMMARAMTALCPRHRAVLQLRYLDDWSAQATGVFLGLAPNAVDQLTHRARARLRAEMERLKQGSAALTPFALFPDLRGVLARWRERLSRAARETPADAVLTSASLPVWEVAAVMILGAMGSLVAPASAAAQDTSVELTLAVAPRDATAELAASRASAQEPPTAPPTQGRPSSLSASVDTAPGGAPVQAHAEVSAGEDNATLRSHVTSRLGGFDNDTFAHLESECEGVTMGTACWIVAESNRLIPPDGAATDTLR